MEQIINVSYLNCHGTVGAVMYKKQHDKVAFFAIGFDWIYVFLDTTFRMHSAANQYISNAIYQGQLKSHPDNDKQIIQVPANYSGLLIKKRVYFLFL